MVSNGAEITYLLLEKNESLNDPNYQRRMEVFRKEVDPYEKGYEEGYNDAKREYGN